MYTNDFNTDETEETTFTVEQIRDEETTEEQLQQVINEMGDNWPRIIALACVLQIDYENARDNITEGRNGETYEYGNEEYLVVTDSEADKLWDEYLDNYIEECVLHEIPEQYRMYFDDEKFKDDCKMDGRGHCLAGYDGEEQEEKVDGTYFYIYRTN